MKNKKTDRQREREKERERERERESSYYCRKNGTSSMVWEKYYQFATVSQQIYKSQNFRGYENDANITSL